MVIPLLSVTHGQCDARPTVTFPAYAGTKFRLYYENATHQLKNVPKTPKNYLIETHKNILRKRIGLHRVNENVTDSPASPVV